MHNESNIVPLHRNGGNIHPVLNYYLNGSKNVEFAAILKYVVISCKEVAYTARVCVYLFVCLCVYTYTYAIYWRKENDRQFPPCKCQKKPTHIYIYSCKFLSTQFHSYLWLTRITEDNFQLRSRNFFLSWLFR